MAAFSNKLKLQLGVFRLFLISMIWALIFTYYVRSLQVAITKEDYEVTPY